MNEQEFTRRETFLKKIAGYSVDKLPEPLTREEVYLKKIAENGIGGSGGADLSDYAKKADVATAIEKALEDSVGDISTALAVMVEV